MNPKSNHPWKRGFHFVHYRKEINTKGITIAQSQRGAPLDILTHRLRAREEMDNEKLSEL